MKKCKTIKTTGYPNASNLSSRPSLWLPAQTAATPPHPSRATTPPISDLITTPRYQGKIARGSKMLKLKN